MQRPCSLTRLLVAPALILAATTLATLHDVFAPSALAEPANDDAEKQAFDAAKELGTADAWQAFLKSYGSGFRADLARAYLKKLGDGQSNAPPAASAASVSMPPAQDIPCQLAQTLKSKNSNTPSTIKFINRSGASRAIQWKSFDGTYKDYGVLEDGQELTQQTFLTHPWIAANGPGDCAQAFLPVPGTSEAILTVTNDQMAARQREEETDHGPTPVESCREVGKVYVDGICVSKSKQKKSEKSARASCQELDMYYRNGQCVAKYKKDKVKLKAQQKKGCPKGTYLNPLGVCQPDETGG